MLANFITVGLGGFLGSMARYAVYLGEKRWLASSFPLGTLTVNCLGCFLAGLASAYAERLLPGQRSFVLFASVGFLGAFTTFSAFGVETLGMLRESGSEMVFLNISLNVGMGIGAVWLGRTAWASFV